MPKLILICGPQAVGKMTVGQELLNSVNKYRLNSEDGEIKHKKYIRINNNNLSAEVVAKMIKDEFKL